MQSEPLWAFFGMFVGVLTGFFFERRALNASRAEAAQLRSELDRLKMLLLTVRDRRSDPPAEMRYADMDHEVVAWMRSHQDADGRVSRSSVFSHFLRNSTSKDLDLALAQLTAKGAISVEDEWLRIL